MNQEHDFAIVPDFQQQRSNGNGNRFNDMQNHMFNPQQYQPQYGNMNAQDGGGGALPQHFMQGVPGGDVYPFNANSGGQPPPVNMFAPVHQQQQAPSIDKPTAAQAAAIRLQRASARQAAKAAQQQKRTAQQARGAAAAAKSRGGAAGGAGGKRKKDEAEEEEEDDDDDDSDDDDDDDDEEDDATVPGVKQPKPHEIAKTKYNHIEDDKERKRLKRLLRNRVSAQQARERKKGYMSTLEDGRRDMETKMAELEAKVNTLERENFMLRQVVKNATQGKGGSEKHITA